MKQRSGKGENLTWCIHNISLHEFFCLMILFTFHLFRYFKF